MRDATQNHTKSITNRGFTLVELVTTLIVVGIVAAAVVPRFFDTVDFDQRTYADELASALRTSRKVAIASNCEVRVSIGALGYSAFQRNSLVNCDARTGGWNTPVHRNDGSALSGLTPKGVAPLPAATVTFNTDGTAALPTPIIVVGPFTVSVNASGTVTVSP